MNAKALPFILAALVCAAVLIAEEQRIGGLRQSLAQLQKDTTAAQEQMNRDAAELKKLRERSTALASESEQLRAHLTEAKAAAPDATAGGAGVKKTTRRPAG